MIIKADFHLHSCLSPCGDLSMSPNAIAAILAEKGVRLAALTDHNTALNCPAFGYACRVHDIIPLYGIEAQPQEECHILCLFGGLDSALELGQKLYELMPPVMNNPEKMGDQIYVNEDEEILGEVDKYLITSAEIGLEDLSSLVLRLGGIVIPAHVDRPAFSLTSQLGFIPDGPWSALEVVRMPTAAGIDTRAYPLITSSDAHYPEHIGRRPFDLDIGGSPLTGAGGSANMETIKAALARRPRQS
ncbi:PHP domain-containing protein [Brucepastera parasyntrophica]|uniref:PHP domain-containing protein n=1 Tax=Brucepastera parasyntrophica TaxID=2880008 RepID=UPI00210B6F02|nr:PHP domain-containing protein [Brucepastera parasyntrophica]ULQ58943.1 PHP domain-containing protein [Brucepastera parasyntrophica]